jgi:SAM-dependent methyltransferase
MQQSNPVEFWESVWSSAKQRYPSEHLNPDNVLPWEIHNHDPYLPQILRKLNNKSGSVIDVGCGSGHSTNFFFENGYSPLGIDIAPTAIQKAKQNFPNINFECKDILRDRIDQKFNLVFDRGCLHGFQRDGFIYEKIFSTIFLNLYKILADGGEIVLIAGNKNQIGNNRTTSAPRISISEIERTSFPLFKIKSVEEIIYKQYKSYGDSLGWLFILEKM